jgi:hypothetical protein
MKLYSTKKILLPGDVEIPPRSVFEATQALATQLKALGSAREATKAEIAAATAKASVATGTAFTSAKAEDGKLIADGIEPVTDASEKVKA